MAERDLAGALRLAIRSLNGVVAVMERALLDEERGTPGGGDGRLPKMGRARRGGDAVVVEPDAGDASGSDASATAVVRKRYRRRATAVHKRKAGQGRHRHDWYCEPNMRLPADAQVQLFRCRKCGLVKWQRPHLSWPHYLELPRLPVKKLKPGEKLPTCSGVYAETAAGNKTNG